MAPNFTECGIIFKANSTTLYRNYSYTGPVFGAIDPTHRPALITYAGCLRLCGQGSQKYPWAAAANTITTWVLPIMGGLLLQAPFESNRFWRTVFAVTRWVGSPIAALSYVLWNINVTAKCALMVDMITMYDEVLPEGSLFAQMRDSFYILAIMNQYSSKPLLPARESEMLLRIALFSNSLRLSRDQLNHSSLKEHRELLARDLRRGRRRGIVPVLVSFLWFLVSLGLSLQLAFGELGANATAHNLALGLLLAWLPVLIMGSIVDRDPLSADDVRQSLNVLLDKVRHALLDPELRDSYMIDTSRTDDDFAWTGILANDDFFHNDFFVDFAGQGRLRWHYGVAHSILASIEEFYVNTIDRDWVRNSEIARTHLVIGPDHLRGLRWFDLREIWQISAAFFVFLGTTGGAFCLSYFTPTVGLGCRSGGYLIFVVIAIFNFTLEMLTWWIMGARPCRRNIMIRNVLERTDEFQAAVLRRWRRADSDSWANLKILVGFWTWYWPLPFQTKIDYFILRPLDLINTCWLIYIVLAQTFGWYRTCKCMSSVWSSQGGYIDFESIDYHKAHGVIRYWASSTAVSIAILITSVFFITVEWCEQSHLSSEDHANAHRGLLRTHKWRKFKSGIQYAPVMSILLVGSLWQKVRGGQWRRRRTRLVRKQRLVWMRQQSNANDDGDDGDVDQRSRRTGGRRGRERRGHRASSSEMVLPMQPLTTTTMTQEMGNSSGERPIPEPNPTRIDEVSSQLSVDTGGAVSVSD